MNNSVRTMCGVFVLAFAWSNIAGVSFAQQGLPSAKEVLEKIQNTRRPVPPYSMRFEQNTDRQFLNWRGPESGTFPITQGNQTFQSTWRRPNANDRFAMEIRIDGVRRDETRSQFLDRGNGVLVPYSNRQVSDGEQIYSFSDQSALYADTMSPEDLARNAYRLQIQPDYRGQVPNQPMQLEGFGMNGESLVDYMQLDAILRTAPDLAMRPAMEKIDGADCYVLEGTTEMGAYTVWIDPATGYLPRRMTVTKGPDDTHRGRKLSEPSANEWEPQENPINGEKDSLESTMENVRIEEIDGRFFIVDVTITTEIVYRDGMRSIETQQLARRDIVFNPDFEAMGAFELEVPNGTRVWMSNAAGGDFEWRDGKIIPRVDSSVLASIQNKVREISDGPGDEEESGSESIEAISFEVASVAGAALPMAEKPLPNEPQTGSGWSFGPIIGVSIVLLIGLFVWMKSGRRLPPS